MDKFVLLFCVVVLACDTCQGNNKSAAVRNNLFGSLNAYYVYTRDNPRVPERLQPTEASVNGAARFFRTKTVVLVHDEGGGLFNTLNTVVKDALLTSENVTVLVVDWSTIAGLPDLAPGAVPYIASSTADLVRLLISSDRVNVARLHFVGFGLGAHIVGHLARIWNGNITRITGLDPTGGTWTTDSGRLRTSDAKYVEVIHTDSGYSGIDTAIGHVDFYVDGGISQPGCADGEAGSKCNHDRSWELFAASLTDGGLVGNMCVANSAPSDENCRGYTVPMGNNELEKFGSGSFFFETSDKYPYNAEVCVQACTTEIGPTTVEPSTTDFEPTTTVEVSTTEFEPTTTVEVSTTEFEPTTTVEASTTEFDPTTTVEASTTEFEPTTTVEASTTEFESTTVEASTTEFFLF